MILVGVYLTRTTETAVAVSARSTLTGESFQFASSGTEEQVRELIRREFWNQWKRFWFRHKTQKVIACTETRREFDSAMRLLESEHEGTPISYSLRLHVWLFRDILGPLVGIGAVLPRGASQIRASAAVRAVTNLDASLLVDLPLLRARNCLELAVECITQGILPE